MEHFGLLLDQPLAQTIVILSYLTMGSADASGFVPHVPRVARLFNEPNMGMEAQLLQVLLRAGGVKPDGNRAVVAVLGSIEDKCFSLAAGDVQYAQLLGALVCAAQPPESDLLLDLIIARTSAKRFGGQHCGPILLNAINNALLAGAFSHTSPLADALPTFQTNLLGGEQLLVSISDLLEGRSLKSVDAKVDALDAKVSELNSRVKETCSDFDEVKAYVDANISELKEFVGEIAKKLPQPSRLTILSGVQKTIQLHFACASTGEEWTCETSEWHQWLKMGFSLLKLGSCVVDVAAGNYLGAFSKGANVIKGV